MFQIRHYLSFCCKRWYSSALPKYTMEHLKERSLLRVAGVEVPEFLQGLITNDIHHLDNGVGSMYTLFLNTKGRVLYDAIIYRTPAENSFLVECDAEVIESLAKHLKLYRVRRKIDISNIQNEYTIYALFNTDKLIQNNTLKENTRTFKETDFIVPCTPLNKVSSKECTMYRDLLIFCDPRIVDLGLRVLTPLNSGIKDQLSGLFSVDNSKTNYTYRWLRYNLGVGEGVMDLPPGDCFPLECNCDYLHGISFHKGCYIGQELTARTHHTGVVRKRLMPLYFSQNVTKLPTDKTIMHDNTNLGKLRGIEENVGLGLLRIVKALEYKDIKIGDGLAETVKPLWWPLEAPKEKLSSKKG